MSASASTPTVNAVPLAVAGEAEAIALISAGATVLAAIILGGIAAWTSDLRLRKQLKAEEDRQRATLKHNRELSEATLANNRELADLDDLRSLFDEAAVALDATEDTMVTAETFVRLADDADEVNSEEKGAT